MMQRKIGLSKASFWTLFYWSLLFVFLSGLHGRALSQEIEDCLECHQDRELTKLDDSGKVHSLYVDKSMFLASAHGQMNYTCVDCHTEASPEEHPAEGLPDVDCGDCHEDIQKKYLQSEHGKLLVSANSEAPMCYDCHTKHYNYYRDDPRSTVNQQNIASTCGTCHKGEIQGPGLLARLSVLRVKAHGKAYMAGDYHTEHCLNCHFETGAHGAKKGEHPAVCEKCHKTHGDTEGPIFGPFHNPEAFRDRAFTRAIIIFYGIGFIIIAFAFMSLAGKKYEQQESKKKES